MIKSYLLLGAVLLVLTYMSPVFTIYTNDGQQAVESDVLTMLRSGTLSVGTAG